MPKQEMPGFTPEQQKTQTGRQNIEARSKKEVLKEHPDLATSTPGRLKHLFAKESLEELDNKKELNDLIIDKIQEKAMSDEKSKLKFERDLKMLARDWSFIYATSLLRYARLDSDLRERGREYVEPFLYRRHEQPWEISASGKLYERLGDLYLKRAEERENLALLEEAKKFYLIAEQNQFNAASHDFDFKSKKMKEWTKDNDKKLKNRRNNIKQLEQTLTKKYGKYKEPRHQKDVDPEIKLFTTLQYEETRKKDKKIGDIEYERKERWERQNREPQKSRHQKQQQIFDEQEETLKPEIWTETRENNFIKPTAQAKELPENKTEQEPLKISALESLTDRENNFIKPTAKRLERGESLIFTGLERGGKTTVLQKIEQELQTAANIQIINFNCQLGAETVWANLTAELDKLTDDAKPVLFFHETGDILTSDQNVKKLTDIVQKYQVVLEFPYRAKVLAELNNIAGLENQENNVFVPNFSQADTGTLLEQLSEHQFKSQEIEEFYKLTGGHPYVVSWLAQVELKKFDYSIQALKNEINKKISAGDLSHEADFAGVIFEAACWNNLDQESREILIKLAKLEDLPDDQTTKEKIELLKNLNLIRDNQIVGEFFKEFILSRP